MKAICVFCLVLTLLFINLPFHVEPVKAEGADGAEWIQLPDNWLPYGIDYDAVHDVMWVSLYGTCGIAKVNCADKTYEAYWFLGYPLEIYEGGKYIAYVPEVNKVYISDHNATVFDVESCTFERLYIGSRCMAYYQGYVWYHTPYNESYSSLVKLDPHTNTIVNTYPMYLGCFDGYWGVVAYIAGYNNAIWMSEIFGGSILRFDIATEQITQTCSGFNRPLGLAFNGDYIYVAECSHGPNTDIIKTYEISTNTVIETLYLPVTYTEGQDGVAYLCLDSNKNLRWTDGTKHYGIISTTTLYTAVYTSLCPYNHCLEERPNNSTIWFSAKGSSYIGIRQEEKFRQPDLNNDTIVNILDAVVISRNAGKTIE